MHPIRQHNYITTIKGLPILLAVPLNAALPAAQRSLGWTCMPIFILVMLLFPTLVLGRTYGPDNVTAVTTCDAILDDSGGADYTTLDAGIAGIGVGQTLCVKAGNYTSAALTLTSRHVVAYNDEAVTINGCLKLDGTASINDVTFTNTTETNCGLGGGRYTLNVLGTATGVAVRHSEVQQCQNAADKNQCRGVLVVKNASSTSIAGNWLRGLADAGNVMTVYAADGTIIEYNRFTQAADAGNDGDLLSMATNINTNQMSCGNPMFVRGNKFETATGEEAIDNKGAGCTQTINFENNTFLGSGLASGSCLLQWAHKNTVANTVNIRRNVFDRCNADNSRAIAIGEHSGCAAGECNKFTGEIAHNVFHCLDGATKRRALTYANTLVTGGDVHHNTFLDCQFVFNNAEIVFQNFRSNILENPVWVNAGNISGTCSHNNNRNVTGTSGFTCTNGTTDDPQFNNYNPRNTSLIATAHDGSSRGALQPFGYSSCLIAANGTTVTCLFAALFMPVQDCDPADFTISCSTTGAQNPTSCTPTGSDLTFGMATPIQQRETCTISVAAGQFSDGMALGGPASPVVTGSENLAVTTAAMTNDSLIERGGERSSLITIANRMSATTSAGSGFHDAQGRRINNCYDGIIPTTDFATQSCSTSDASFTVVHDLGSQIDLGDFLIGGDDEGTLACNEATVEVSTNCTDYSTVVDAETCLGRQLWTYPVNETAQCVRITVAGTVGTQVGELALFAAGSLPPPVGSLTLSAGGGSVGGGAFGPP